jgi:hypothetical protein
LQVSNGKTNDALGILAVGLTVFLIAAMLTYWLAAPRPTSREAWIVYHRKQLDTAFQSAHRGGPCFPIVLFLMAINLFNNWHRDPAILLRVVAMLVSLNIIFALARFRATRLRKEMELLQ